MHPRARISVLCVLRPVHTRQQSCRKRQQIVAVFGNFVAWCEQAFTQCLHGAIVAATGWRNQSERYSLRPVAVMIASWLLD